MVAFPNAKINLGLNVVSRRPDGYHDIETVMMPIGWSDVLEIVAAAGSETTLTVTGRGVDCPPEKNLVMKAYRAAAERFERVAASPVDIFLHKVVPDGAGLGGGSSDAAFTIRLLNDIFELGMSLEEMAAIAATIGADCPFFIYNRPMLCTATGTEMRPFELPDFGPDAFIALAKPQAGVSTARAYAGVVPAQAVPPVREAAAAPIELWQRQLHNDFEPSVINACPEIATVMEVMRQLNPVYCAMSGSGSTVFGIFRGSAADNLSPFEVEQRLHEEIPCCDIFIDQPGK